LKKAAIPPVLTLELAPVGALGQTGALAAGGEASSPVESDSARRLD